jgi:hypothetical protein
MTAGRSHWQRYFGPVPAGPQPPHVSARVLEPACGRARDDAAEPVPFAMTAMAQIRVTRRQPEPQRNGCPDLARRP